MDLTAEPDVLGARAIQRSLREPDRSLRQPDRSLREPDVLVLGGGPSGCAAARLLATWGLDVVVVERSLGSGDSGRALAESLPPSARKVLAAAGLLGVVEAAGFHPNTGNTALWNGERRSDGFGRGAAGFHVLRSRFDDLLRMSAAAAGAAVVAATARRPVRTEGGGWIVPVDWGRPGAPVHDARREAVGPADAIGQAEREEGPWPPEVRPKWVLDCTGRTGVLARRHRVLEREAPTLAVLRRYAAPLGAAGWPGIDPGHALAESFERGWAWSVPTSQDERHVALMLDPELHVAMADPPELSAPFETEVAATRLIGEVTRRGRPTGEAWAVAASMYSSATVADGRALIVGDASSFVDPMSSYGVKKALASAWLAAVAVHTAIRGPAMERVATAFYGRREREMYAAMRDGLAEQVPAPANAAADSAPRPPFWERRAAWLADRDGPSAGLGTGTSAGASPAARLRDDPGVVAAFRELRSGSGLLRAGSLRTVERPMVAGNRIVMAPAVVTRRFPKGVRHLRDVDVLRVARMAPGGGDPGLLFERYSTWAAKEDAPPVDLADFLGVLAVLVADGVLVAP